MIDFRIQFPTNEDDLSTEEAKEEYFYLITETGQERRMRIHDYAEVYQIPGLYENILCDKLQYQAPQVISKLLIEQGVQDDININDLVVLDVGAGNGISGKVLAELGVTSIVGVDVIPEAAIANQRDYPRVYLKYHIENLACLAEKTHQELVSQKFNALLISGALPHLPFKAFYNALDLITVGGWFAVTLREEVIGQEKSENACQLLEQLINNKTLEIVNKKTYQQRLSINGKPLMGVAIIGKKQTELPSY